MTKLVSVILLSFSGYYCYRLVTFFIAGDDLYFYPEEILGHSLMLLITLIAGLGVWFKKVWAKYLTWLGVLSVWGIFAILYFSLLFTGQYTQNADLTRASITIVLLSAIAIFLCIGVSKIGANRNG